MGGRRGTYGRAMTRRPRSAALVPATIALTAGLLAAPAPATATPGTAARTSAAAADATGAADVASATGVSGPGGRHGHLPETIALPTGSLPEGIAQGCGTTFYAGSRADGSIVVGDLRTGSTRQLVAGVSGRVAVGMSYEARADRLWVAGGATGAVTAYDGSTGQELGRWVVPGSDFLNDVEVTREGVYVTDSAEQRLVVVPLGRRGALPAADGAKTLAITGDLVYGPGFNANGIRAHRDALIVTQSSTGDLFRVDPRTGASDRIEVSGRDLTAGDGLVLRGRTLYVVFGFSTDSAAVVRLSRDGRSGEVVGEVGDPDLDRPTTGVLAAGALWLVNGRFEVADPRGADYQVVRVDLR